MFPIFIFEKEFGMCVGDCVHFCTGIKDQGICCSRIIEKDFLIEIFYLYRVRSCQIIFNVNSMIIGSEIDTGTYYYENRNDQNKNPFFSFSYVPLNF